MPDPEPLAAPAPDPEEPADADPAAEDETAVANSNVPVTVDAPPPVRAAEPAAFVVSGPRGGTRGFDSFPAAVADAYRGDVITIHRDGLVENLRDVVKLTGIDLTIRAGERPDGTPYEPRLEGQPQKQDLRALFYLSGRASLRLEGISVVLPLSEERDGWGVFSIGGGDRLDLVRCSVTLIGSEGRAPLNAILRVRGAAPADPDLLDPSDRDRVDPLSFRASMTRCLLRGGGDPAARPVEVQHALLHGDGGVRERQRPLPPRLDPHQIAPAPQ